MTASAPLIAPTSTAPADRVTVDARARAGTDVHLAHAPEWLEIIQRAYGHRPLVLRTRDGAGRLSTLQAIVVRRPIVGAVVVSMPFLDGGGPFGDAPETHHVLVDRLLADARSVGARAVDLRTSVRLEVETAPNVHKVNLVLPLPPSPDALWTRAHKNVRNEVRKAEKSGLRVEETDARGLDVFYAIHQARMHDLGSPAHSRRFFDEVLTAFGSRARLLVVKKEALAIGGLLAIETGTTLTVPWASCRREYFPLCPNMLLYWETIRGACERGVTRFDFGRSTRGSGTWRFKRQWGAEEEPLYWYTLPVGRSGVHTTPSPATPGDRAPRASRLVTSAWRRLPPAVSAWLGPRVRRYLVQ